MTDLLFGLPTAAYDPAGTAIKLSYDADAITDNLAGDPAFTHELTHYAQNIGTALGIETTFMWHELFAAASRILLHDTEFTLPLVKSKRTSALHWDNAELARSFLQDVVGSVRVGDLHTFAEALPTIRGGLVSGSLSPGSPNPFFINFRPPGPGVGLRIPGYQDIFFRIDGYFVQELHAHSSEFIARWVHERLSIDEAVSAFLPNYRRPWTLLYFLVQKTMTERMGRGIYDVQDSVFVCNLCSLLALNANGLPEDVPGLRWSVIRGERMGFRFRDTGEAFLLLLSACLDELRDPGNAIMDYFGLMDRTLAKLNWPTFAPLMESLPPQTLALLKQIARGRRDDYELYLLTKAKDSRTAIDWLLRCYHGRDVMGFVGAPLHLVADKRVTGPVVSGPTTHASLVGDKPSREQMRGLLVAFLTRKLWFGSDLTCQEQPGGPHAGSVAGCDLWPECKATAPALDGVSYCSEPTWLRCLAVYPGLAGRLGI